MNEALAAASPFLLEPVRRLIVVTPSGAASRISSAIAGRRGQVLGIGPRDGWTGWERIEAMLPESEMRGLEAEFRSLSQGLASFDSSFGHLAEVNAKLASEVIQQRQPEPA